MGRRRKNLPANGLDIIRQAAANGLNEVGIARALGLAFETWKRIRDEDPEAKAVWEEARALERDTLVGVLFRKAVEKQDIVAAMFLLKSRHGYRDNGPADGAEGARVAVQINIPGALSSDQFARLVEVAPAALPSPEEEAA